MQLNQCVIDEIAAVRMAPLTRTAPEVEWVEANGEGKIPSSLYGLYQRASFFSFGASPPYLSDAENLLFSYFALVVRSVQESLVEAHEQADLFAAAHELVYDPAKLVRKEEFHKGAERRAGKHFRDIVIALQTSLDALADVVAILFPRSIAELKVGRAHFSKIEHWIKRPPPSLGLLASPNEFYLKKLYDSIGPVINAPHPETDWLPMMRLLRNKAAHLGQPLFRQVGLPRASDGKFFVFLPRKWPYLWEKDIRLVDQHPAVPFPQLIRDVLMHQDVVCYARGLIAKVKCLIAVAFVVINDAYEQFKDLPKNEAALTELKGNFRGYDFERFVT
jgi:hypothetical protein